MPVPAVKRRGPNRNNKRELLLGAATNLFESLGVSGTSMDMIAESAGVGKATLYHYFASKGEIVDVLYTEFVEHMRQSSMPHLQKDAPATTRLLDAIAELPLVRSRYRGGAMYLIPTADIPEKSRRRLLEARNRVHSSFEDVVRKGIEDGEFVEVDPNLIVMGIFGLANSWIFNTHHTSSPAPWSSDVVRDLCSAFLSGLRPRRR